MTCCWIFFFLLIARLVLDYVQMFARSWRPTGVVLVLAEVIYTITDPPLKALRRLIPPLRIGRDRAGPVVPGPGDLVQVVIYRRQAASRPPACSARPRRGSTRAPACRDHGRDARPSAARQ